MEKYIEALDELLLIPCTQFSHWFQDLTGKTNFTIARILMLVVVVQNMLSILNSFNPFLERYRSDLDVLLAFILFWAMARVLNRIRETEKMLGEGKHANPYRHVMLFRFIRLYGLLMISLEFFVLMEYVLSLKLLDLFEFMKIDVLILVFFFMAVEPKPPATSKVTKWLRGLSEGLARPREAHA